jgi:hypothetical protein
MEANKASQHGVHTEENIHQRLLVSPLVEGGGGEEGWMTCIGSCDDGGDGCRAQVDFICVHHLLCSADLTRAGAATLAADAGREGGWVDSCPLHAS